MTKRIISVLLSILMILSSMPLAAFAAEEPVLSFGEAVVSGDEVKVPVELSGLPVELVDLSAFTMKYTYTADKLMYVNTESAALTIDEDHHREGSVSWYSRTAVEDISDTTLFYLVFKTLLGATGEVELATQEIELGSSGIEFCDIENAQTSFDLEAIVPAEISMDAQAKGSVVEIPVTLNKIPDELDGNIAAFTFGYTYDTKVLSYKETKAGILSVGSDNAVAGKVSWFDKTAPVTDVNDVLFTLVFDVIDNTAEETRVEPGVIEIADATFNFTEDVVATGVDVELTPAPVPVEDAVLALGDAVITDAIVKIPVTLDKVPEDIADIAAMSLHYTFDKTALTYTGTESGLIDVNDFAVEGNVSWYSKNAIAKDSVDNSVLFTLVFEVKAEQSGNTTVAVDMVEMSGSAMKATQKLGTKDVTFELPEISAPVENAKLTFGPADVNMETGLIMVPVTLDKIPDDIIDLSAVTVKYSYDADKITYEGAQNGILEVAEAYAAQGVVSWYSKTPVTEAGTLFTLIFSTNNEVSGYTSVAPVAVELADSKFAVSKLVDVSGCRFEVPEIAAPVERSVLALNTPSIDGKVVKVPVTLDMIPADIEDMAAVTMLYKYDTTVLNYKGIEAGVVPATADEASAGCVSWYSKTPVTEAGTLFTLVFEVPYGVSGTTKIEITAAEIAGSNMKPSAMVDTKNIEFELPTVEAPMENAKVVYGPATVVGGKISIPVSIDQIPADIDNMAAITLLYSYDNTKMTYAGAKNGILDVTDMATDGKVSWFSKTPVTDVGTLLTLEFDLVPGASGEVLFNAGEVEIADLEHYVSQYVEVIGTTITLVAVDEIEAKDVTIPVEDQEDIKKYIEEKLAQDGITVTYDDGTEEIVYEGFTVEVGSDNKTATITYGDKTFVIDITLEGPAYENVYVRFGKPSISDRNIEVPVILDKMPGDIVDIAALKIDYSYDKTKLTYKGVKAGVVPVDGDTSSDGHISWFNNIGIAAPADGSVLLTLKFEAAYELTGDTTIGVDVVEIGDSSMKASEYVLAEGVTFTLPYVPTPGPSEPVLGGISVTPEALEIPLANQGSKDAIKAYVEANISVMGSYSDNQNRPVAGYTVEISADETKATVKFKGFEDVVTLTKEVKKLKAIVVTPDTLDILPDDQESVDSVKAVVEAAIKAGTIKIEATYSNSADVDPVTSGYTVAVANDKKSATVTYEGKTDVITLTLVEKEVKEITVTPDTLDILPDDQESVDSVKAVVEAAIKDGTIKIEAKYSNSADVDAVTSGYTVTVADDKKSATVTYEGKTDVIALTLVEKEVKEITVAPAELKIGLADQGSEATVKAAVEKAIADGKIKITVTYTNSEDVDDITEGYAVEISADGSKATVSYEGKTADIALTYEQKILSGISVLPASIKVPYTEQHNIQRYVETNITSVIAEYENADPEYTKAYTTVIKNDNGVYTAVITHKTVKATINLELETEPVVLESIVASPNTIEIPAKYSDDIKTYIENHITSVVAVFSNGEEYSVAGYKVVAEQADENGEGKAVIYYAGKTSEINYEIVPDKDLIDVIVEIITTVVPGAESEDIKEFFEENIRDVIAQYEDEEIIVEDYEIEIDEEAGTITIRYGDKETQPISYEIDNEKQVTGIHATPDSIRIPYEEQDDIEGYIRSLADLKVTAEYDDGSSNVVPKSKCIVEVENNVVKVTYEGYWDEVALVLETKEEADEKIIKNISVSPTRVIVPYGTEDEAQLIRNKIEVLVVYENDDPEYTTKYDIAVDGDVATITYTASVDQVYTAEIAITRPVVITSIEANKNTISIDYEDWSDKTSEEIAAYIKSLNGFVIYAKKSDGTKEDVTDMVDIAVDIDEEKAEISYAGFTIEISLDLESDSDSGSSGGGSGGKGSYGYKDIVVPIVPGPIGQQKPETGVFEDIDADHYAFEAIETLYERGIISGDGTNKVYPNVGITREETAKVAIGINNIELVKGLPINFVDANEVSSWAIDYVATAIEEGILTGYGDGTLKPRKTVTRGEMVAIIIRALGVQTNDATTNFSDVPSDLWSAKYISAASQLGFVNGYEDGSFRPEQAITRAEAFMIYFRVLQFRDALTAAAIG